MIYQLQVQENKFKKKLSIIINICFYSDPIKRRQLPAWIRDGLEKMEREKLRAVEREKLEILRLQELEARKKIEDEARAVLNPAKSKFVSVSF